MTRKKTQGDMGRMPSGEYLSVNDVCQELHVSRTTVEQWIDDAALPHYRLGARYDPEYFIRKGKKPGKIVVLKGDLDLFVRGSPKYGRIENRAV